MAMMMRRMSDGHFGDVLPSPCKQYKNSGNNYQIHKNIADYYICMEMWEDALQHYRKALEMCAEGDRSLFRTKFAILCNRMSRHADVIELYSDACQDELEERDWVERGNAFMGYNQDKKAACDCYSRALSISYKAKSRNTTLICERLILLYSELGDDSRAYRLSNFMIDAIEKEGTESVWIESKRKFVVLKQKSLFNGMWTMKMNECKKGEREDDDDNDQFQ